MDWLSAAYIRSAHSSSQADTPSRSFSSSWRRRRENHFWTGDVSVPWRLAASLSGARIAVESKMCPVWSAPAVRFMVMFERSGMK